MKEFNNLKDSPYPLREGDSKGGGTEGDIRSVRADESSENPEGMGANPEGGVASDKLFHAGETPTPPGDSPYPLKEGDTRSVCAGEPPAPQDGEGDSKGGGTEGNSNDFKDFKDLKPLKEVKEVKEVRSASQEHVLSRYAKCQPATDIQIKNFIKTLASLFNQTSVFWQIITRELLDMRPTYDHLKDLYHYLTRVYPYPTITAQTILGFNTQIKTFNAEEMSNLMHRFPDKRFAKISLPEEGKYVYTTLEEAEKTNIDYDVIESLRERYDLPC